MLQKKDNKKKERKKNPNNCKVEENLKYKPNPNFEVLKLLINKQSLKVLITRTKSIGLSKIKSIGLSPK